jgi:hypothetical protein
MASAPQYPNKVGHLTHQMLQTGITFALHHLLIGKWTRRRVHLDLQQNTSHRLTVDSLRGESLRVTCCLLRSCSLTLAWARWQKICESFPLRHTFSTADSFVAVTIEPGKSALDFLPRFQDLNEAQTQLRNCIGHTLWSSPRWGQTGLSVQGFQQY